MSNQSVRNLRGGEYYGRVFRRRQFPDLSLTEVRHFAPVSLPRHSHEQAYLSLLLQGNYEEAFSRRPVTHPPLRVMWHPVGLTHQDRVGGGGCHFFNLEVSESGLNRLREIGPIVADPRVFQGPDAGRLMMRLYREFREGDASSELTIEELWLVLSASLIEGAGWSERRKPVWLLRVEAKLRDEFPAKLAMAALAAEAGVHPAHLAAVFRRFHRTTIGEYVHRLRVDDACAMLRQPGIPLTQIALELGFADQSHFSRVFHRQMGMTPGRWRNLMAVSGGNNE
ncbi:MAG: helix-turn-helix transcriptional regulator [Blastocatellia bacterium]|nr:helix-turn-helix transcriptional regulator [Blastocatellia bacterium]